jgi:hypothetical protein
VADSAYCDSRRRGVFLEERKQPYVLALSGKAYVWADFYHHRASMLLDALRRKGEPALEEAEGGGWRLLVRRSIEDPDELTAYMVFCAEGKPLEELAKVAGMRWRVEIGFEEAKGEVGLAHYEVRSWHG